MDIIRRIKDFDFELTIRIEPKNKVKLYLLGGSALVIHKLISRATYDIDAIFDTPFNSEIENMMNKYDINTRASMFDNFFPPEYEKRLTKLDIDTKSIDVYVLSVEDLIISKIVAGRDKDLKDIEEIAHNYEIDWGVLERLKKTTIEYLLNDRMVRQFLYDYELYEKEFRK